MQVLASHVEDQQASDSVQAAVELGVALTIPQAAVFARTSDKTIRRMIGKGIVHPTRDSRGAYLIDRAELEYVIAHSDGKRLASKPPTPPTATALAAVQGPARGLLEHDTLRDYARTLASLTESLVARIQQQAEEIGSLRAQLAAATVPKSPRAARATPRRPRMSVPLDDPRMAAALLARRFGPAELGVLVRSLSDEREPAHG